ncbi:MAG: dethiobiotin synthase [Muribaculaceae bacterium]|nr:dethiobiotin synthase [Muribaculaceae bacterium]
MKYFVTGIGTDVGKSWATGWLARRFMKEGKSVITQKFIQTGNLGYSEDIDVHRQIMGIEKTQEDVEMLTAPEIFTYPCSPDLAARIDGREIDFAKIEKSTEILESRYDVVLIEGAGGIMVPLKGEYLTIDYIKEKNLPVIVVTNGQLGSINHTLLTLYAIKQYGIDIAEVVYNHHFDKDTVICTDTIKYLKDYLRKNFPTACFREMSTQTS